jgi:hypothetical protein
MPLPKTRPNEGVLRLLTAANLIPPLFDKTAPATVYSQVKKFGILFHFLILFFIVLFALGGLERCAGAQGRLTTAQRAIVAVRHRGLRPSPKGDRPGFSRGTPGFVFSFYFS